MDIHQIVQLYRSINYSNSLEFRPFTSFIWSYIVYVSLRSEGEGVTYYGFIITWVKLWQKAFTNLLTFDQTSRQNPTLSGCCGLQNELSYNIISFNDQWRVPSTLANFKCRTRSSLSLNPIFFGTETDSICSLGQMTYPKRRILQKRKV